MAGKMSFLFLLMVLAQRGRLLGQRIQPKLVLLTDSHHNITSLIIQMAVEQVLQRVTENTGHSATSYNDSGAPRGVVVKQTSWPADLRPFPLTKSRSSLVCLSRGYETWSRDQSLFMMTPVLTNEDALLLVALTSSCDRAEALVAASSWGCTPPVLVAPLGCATTTDGRLLPVAPIVAATMERVLEEMLAAGEGERGEVSKVSLLVDSKTRPLLEELAPEVLFSTQINVIYAQHLININGDVYRHMNDHRDAYRLFVVFISTSSFKVFDVARSMELLSPVQTWVMLTLDADPSDVGRHLQPTDNVIVIDLRHRFQRSPLPRRISDVITDSNQYLVDLYHIVSVTISEALSHIKKGSLTSFMECQQKLSVGDVESNMRAMTSLRVWITSTHTTSTLTFVGYMNPFSNSALPIPLVRPFQGFHGRKFRITTLPNKIFQIQKEDGTFHGLAFDLLDEIAGDLNFTYQIVPPPDGEWGARRQDGSWTGMVGMVRNREVDFAVGSFTITSSREEAIDFTFPYWQGSAGMIMRTSSDQGRLLVHLRPFSTPVWACLIAAVPLCAITLWTISALSRLVVGGRTEKGIRDKERGSGIEPDGSGRGIQEIHNARMGPIGQGVSRRTVNMNGSASGSWQDMPAGRRVAGSMDRWRSTIGQGVVGSARTMGIMENGGLGTKPVGRGMANEDAHTHGSGTEQERRGKKVNHYDASSGGNRARKGHRSLCDNLKRLMSRLNAHTPGWSKLLLMSIGLPFQQSLTWLPGSGPGRVALGLAWLVFVVLAATYTGNLTAFLAVPKAGVPVDTLDDLAAQTDYSVGLVKGQAINDVVKNAAEGTLYNLIWEKIAADPGNTLPGLAAGHKLVVSSNFIYLDDIKNLVAIQKEEADRGDCSLYIAKQEFYFSGYAFPLQTNSPYLHIFNQEILKILSSGLTQKWMRRYWPKVANKCGMTKIVVKPTSSEDVMGLFYLLIIGIGTAGLIFLIEVVYSRSQRKDFRRQPR